MRIKSLCLKAVVSLLFATSPLIAIGQCVTPPEVGDWHNIDAATRGITRVHVDFACNDQILCGVDPSTGVVHCTMPGPPYTVHLWGKCSPSDCDWGAATGTDYVGSDGTHWIYVFYNQGFAKRYVYLTPSRLYPGDLYMWMYTDFTDPHRPDYVLTNWFHH